MTIKLFAQIPTTPSVDSVVDDQTGSLVDSVQNFLADYWWVIVGLIILSFVLKRLSR